MSDRPLGERRRRRLAERAQEQVQEPVVSAGPAPEPPTRPRPVVRPGRTLGGGAATAPVLPTPEARVVGPLLDSSPPDGAPAVPGSRQAFRSQGGPAQADPTPAAPAAPAAPAGPVAPVARSEGGATYVPSSSARPARRRQLLPAVLLAAALVLALVAAFVLTRGDGAGGAAPAVDPTGAGLQQRTLLLVVDDAQGRVGAAALVAVGDDQVDQVLLPENLLLTVADARQAVPLSQAATIGLDSLERGVEDSLAVRVDTSLALSAEELTAVVDGAGGVLVDVQEQVSGNVAVGADQRLAGTQALEYATTEVEGQPLESRLSRFGEVLTALLAALPEEAGEVDALLAGAGASTDHAAAELLAEASALAAEDEVASGVLPTRELAGDQQQALRGPDDDAARAELDSRLAGARLPQSELGEVQVVVRDGVGRPGLVADARDRLVEAGLRYSGGGNTESFDVAATAVLVPEDTPEERARGQAVVDALGAGSLAVSGLESLDTDVVVILGTDFADSVAEEQP